MAEPVTERKSCCHEIVSMYKDNGVDPIEIASEKMRQFIIELTKLEATPKRFVNDMFEVWIRFIRDPETIPEEFLNIPEVREAMDRLTYMSADPEIRAEYKARIREMNRIRAGQTTVKYKEGLVKGKAEGKIEVANDLLKMGLSIEQISEVTELSIDDVRKLA